MTSLVKYHHTVFFYYVHCNPLACDAESKVSTTIDAHIDLVFFAGESLFPMMLVFPVLQPLLILFFVMLLKYVLALAGLSLEMLEYIVQAKMLMLCLVNWLLIVRLRSACVVPRLAVEWCSWLALSNLCPCCSLLLLGKCHSVSSEIPWCCCASLFLLLEGIT